MTAGTLASIFARMSHAEIRMRTESILKAMLVLLASLEPWSPFIATIAQLQEVFDRFKEADDGANTGDFLKSAERNAIRPELNRIVTEIGDYIELGARKDPSLLIKSRFDVRPTKKTGGAPHGPLIAPEKLMLKHGPESGTILCKVAKVPKAKSYEIYIAYKDPTLEENWSYFGPSGGCSSILRGLEPGKNVSVRARAVGSDSTGPFSHPVTIMPV